MAAVCNKCCRMDIKKKTEVVGISNEIAQIRAERKGKMRSVEKYEEMLKKVFEIYDDFICNIEPRLQ